MKYKIFGDNLPAVTITLDRGESVYSQSGGMTWMTDNFLMETNLKGGLLKGLGRMLTGESIFMATYTAQADGAEITFASTFPGSIVAADIGESSIILQKNAFLCAQPTVELSMYVTKGLGAGFFGGEGFLLQRLAGQGMAFFEVDGTCYEQVLAPGEVIKVDTGNVAAFQEGVGYQVERVKGFRNILFGGEGLFLTKLTGPGKVWLQTMPLSGFAARIIPFLPKKSD